LTRCWKALIDPDMSWLGHAQRRGLPGAWAGVATGAAGPTTADACLERATPLSLMTASAAVVPL
jgi:hypothetical protein